MLDDVAVLSKMAAKKTAGMLGDDLALNAQQLTGFSADRELPGVALDCDRIKGAVRTDFILSAEIVAITLSTVADAPFATQVTVLK